MATSSIFNILSVWLIFFISKGLAAKDTLQFIETNGTDYQPSCEGILTVSNYHLSNMFINYSEVYEFAIRSIDSQEESNIRENTTNFKNYYNSFLKYFLDVNDNNKKASDTITFSNWDWLVHKNNSPSVVMCQAILAWADIPEASRTTNPIYLIAYSIYSRGKKCDFNLERVELLHKRVEADLYGLEEEYRVSWCQTVRDSSIGNINIRIMKWIDGMLYAQNIWDIPCQELAPKDPHI